MYNTSIVSKRLWKLVVIVWMLAIVYAMAHHYINQSDFQRFSNMYVAFIEMLSMGHITFDVFNPIPMFMEQSVSNHVDASFSGAALAAVETGVYFPNLASLYTVILTVTGITAADLMLFPIATFVLPVIIIAFSKRLSDLAGPLFTIYILIYLCQHKIFMSAYAAAWAYPLLFIIIFSAFNIYCLHQSKKYSLVLCLSVLSLTLYWHSLAIMATILIISIVLVYILIWGVLPALRIERTTSFNWSLIYSGLLSLIVLLTFTQVWGSVYLTDYSNASPIEHIEIFITNILEKMQGQVNYAVPYQYNYASTTLGMIFLYTHMAIHLISGVLVILPIIFSLILYNARKQQSANIKSNSIITFGLTLVLSVSLAQVIYAVAYSGTALGLVYVPFIFPIFGAFALISFNNSLTRKISLGLLSMLILLSLILTFSSYMTTELGQTSVVKKGDSDPSLLWIHTYVNPDEEFYVDFNLFGKYLQTEVGLSKPVQEFKYLDPRTYGYLVENDKLPLALNNKYVSIDFASMNQGLPIHIYSARALLEPRAYDINNNFNTNKLYHDKWIAVFRFNSTY